MGQRLNIEIMDGEKVLANSYYHWSAYTSSALDLTKQIVGAAGSISNDDKLKYAVALLELTGAGINDTEKHRIEADTEHDYSSIVFMDCNSRNEGLIAVTKEGVEETRYWEEGRVTIHIDSRTIDFSVFWTLGRKEYEDDYEESADNLPLVDSFGFDGIKFEDIYKLAGLIDTYEDGIRLADDTIVRWIA